MSEKKYRYKVNLVASRASTLSGSIDLTKEEAEIVKRVTNFDNWNGRIYLPGSEICFDIDVDNPMEIPEPKEDRPKLKNVLESISGSTPIKIYINDVTQPVFDGKMCNVSKQQWYGVMYDYLDGEVIRLNVDNGAITIGVAT